MVASTSGGKTQTGSQPEHRMGEKKEAKLSSLLAQTNPDGACICSCKTKHVLGQAFSCHYIQEHPISWEDWVAHNLSFKHSKRKEKDWLSHPACTKPCPSSFKDLKHLIFIFRKLVL